MRFGRKQSEALLDPSKVDFVAGTADGVVELVIVDDAPWAGSDGQLSSLKDNVQTYVSVALDSQMGRFSGGLEAAPDGDTDRAAKETYKAAS